MKAAVIVFPGSNCDRDIIDVLGDVVGCSVTAIWHQDRSLQDAHLVILPGGFSFGDYLRCGAIARFSPIMESVISHALAGNPVLGICNGFQVLTECGLLPGTLMPNKSLRFICRDVHVRVENSATMFTTLFQKGQVLNLPIAHADGGYYAEEEVLKELELKNRVIFRYCSANGVLDEENNPNGARQHIAGIVNEEGNVLGMMPHPERHSEDVLGGSDGRWLFESLVANWQRMVTR
ncbi:MAG: phosphoribosylformylglycinamidine synthase subunit PurQ [Symbiobacteriaceae bacterium]|nr:phosphoribosylformylglycinamidine synthase subunit PurQ [Symbiobacteriaceae bacterium]